MRKLYAYCGVMLCLIAICLVFLVIQPKFFPIDESPPDSGLLTQADPEKHPDTLAPIEEPEDTTKAEEPIPYNCPEKLTKAIEQNSDVYAWINIPGTNIDYPIVQSPANDSYYLRRDINKQYLSAGSIMTEHSYNGTDFTDPVTVIYGHCMKSGVMFGKMQSYYSSENGLDNYKAIEIYLPDQKLEYEVFAAVPYDMRHILYNYDFTNPRIFSSFFKSIVSIRSFNAFIKLDEKPKNGDKVLILSTCLKGDSTKRFLVMAKLKKDSFERSK